MDEIPSIRATSGGHQRFEHQSVGGPMLPTLRQVWEVDLRVHPFGSSKGLLEGFDLSLMVTVTVVGVSRDGSGFPTTNPAEGEFMLLSAVWICVHRILSNERSTFFLSESWSDPCDATRPNLSCSHLSNAGIERIAGDQAVSCSGNILGSNESSWSTSSLLFEDCFNEKPCFLGLAGLVSARHT